MGQPRHQYLQLTRLTRFSFEMNQNDLKHHMCKAWFKLPSQSQIQASFYKRTKPFCNCWSEIAFQFTIYFTVFKYRNELLALLNKLRIQKLQSPGGVLSKRDSKKFHKFHWKTLTVDSFFNKVRLLLKIGPHGERVPVYFAITLRKSVM